MIAPQQHVVGVEAGESELDHLLENWDASQGETFSSVIRYCLEMEVMTLEEFRNEFAVAPGSVRRWAKGLSQPLPMFQQGIVTYLRERLRS